MSATRPPALNVLGNALVACCTSPVTGFYRDGYCHTGPQDRGSHTVCVRLSAEFLAFSKRTGNDLSTPRPEYGFAGLKPGDKWCVCVSRWEEAFLAGVAPPVVLEATHERALEVVTLDELQAYALTVR
ncbi:MAG TPA: DUF2237 domain-containing protein [Usitatibacteraceae bacterium]